MECNGAYDVRVGALGDGNTYENSRIYSGQMTASTGACPLSASVSYTTKWLEKGEEATLTASARGEGSDGSLSYQWQERTSGTWGNASGTSAQSSSFPVASSTKGPRTFRVVITAGSTSATSDPITITWVEPVDRKVRKGSWNIFSACPRPGLRWDTKVEFTDGPHFVAILVGSAKSRLGHVVMPGTELCWKARFGTETGGSNSIVVNGILNVLEHELPSDARTLAKLESDSLDFEALEGLYRLASNPSRVFDPDILDCTNCKGGFRETNPSNPDNAYLKIPVVKAAGSHTINDGGKVTTKLQRELPLGFPPPACGWNIPTNLTSVRAVLTYVFQLLFSSLHGCSAAYKAAIEPELSEDLPADIDARAIANKVIDQIILPWEGLK